MKQLKLILVLMISCLSTLSQADLSTSYEARENGEKLKLLISTHPGSLDTYYVYIFNETQKSLVVFYGETIDLSSIGLLPVAITADRENLYVDTEPAGTLRVLQKGSKTYINFLDLKSTNKEPIEFKEKNSSAVLTSIQNGVFSANRHNLNFTPLSDTDSSVLNEDNQYSLPPEMRASMEYSGLAALRAYLLSEDLLRKESENIVGLGIFVSDGRKTKLYIAQPTETKTFNYSELDLK